MSLTAINDVWTAPLTMTVRSIVQIHSGQLVYVSFGSVAPVTADDGVKMREESIMILEAGQIVRFRCVQTTGLIYVGEFK